jgi:Zn-dependent protease with chaperone function
MATTTDPGVAAQDAPFDVRLFGGTVPPTGEDARLSVQATQIEVRSARATVRVPLAQLHAREVISAQRGLELSWESRGGHCAVQLFGEQSLRRLRAHPALRDLPQLANVRRAARRGRVARTVGWSLLALLLLVPVLLLLAFLWQADRIAGALAARIPVVHEQELGRKLFSRMGGQLTLEPDGAAAQAVRDLGARLTRGSRFAYEFHVARDESINAFALPGGIIVVHTGLIEAARRPEELAGVLAHEVQHVEQRHSLEALVKNLGLRGLWAALTGDLGGSLAGQAVVELGSLRFSRDAEREADALGFDTLLRHDIDPRGMVEFFGTMQAAAGASPPAWLSTHPASDARQRAMQEKLDALGGRRFVPLPQTY